MRTKPRVALCATFTIVTACASGSDDAEDTFNTFNEGVEDEEDEDSETGDGDGDPTTTGDGDGDPTTTGDGDGDGDDDPTTTGDGDGDGDIPIEPDNMIDNFEDGDGALIPNNGRQGYWYTFNDATQGGTQTPPSDGVVPEAGGAAGTRFALHTTGSGFAEWGAGIGIDLNNAGGNGIKMIYDASAFTGIVLMARGSGQIRASVQIEATIPPEEGGTCTVDCDPHGKVLLLSSEWQQFTLPFDQLNQEGWGTPAMWDSSKIVGVQFKVAKNVDFDFWVDEIGFY